MFLTAFKRCPLCQGPIEDRASESEQFSIAKCPQCDHQFLNLKTGDVLDIASLYSQENYYSELGGSGMTSEGYVNNGLNDGLSNFYFNIRLKPLAKLLPSNKRIDYLDYGCSAGQIVSIAKNELGWNSSGIDLSETSVNKAQQLGINVRQGAIENLLKEENLYDAISLYHCLEHIVDPSDLLSKLRDKLKDGGLIAIEVPNIKSLPAIKNKSNWKGLLLPYHIHHFHAQSLSKLLVDSGYEIERIWTPYYPQSSSQVLNLLNIYKRFKKIFRHENSIESQRKKDT